MEILKMKKEFQKVIKEIRNEIGGNFPKPMMTGQQMEKNTATVNCGGEWSTKEETIILATIVMNDKRFTDFIEKHSAKANIETNTFGTMQVRINY